MTKYYSSSSNYMYDAVMASILLIGIGIILTSLTEIILFKVLFVVATIGLVLLVIAYQVLRTFDIRFLEDRVQVEFIYPKRVFFIDYGDIQQLEYISVVRSPTANRIQFKKHGKKMKLRFVTVADSDDFIDFVLWLKAKNEAIEVKVFPSDNYMNYKLQEVFGFNYRKFDKGTL